MSFIVFEGMILFSRDLKLNYETLLPVEATAESARLPAGTTTDWYETHDRPLPPRAIYDHKEMMIVWPLCLFIANLILCLLWYRFRYEPEGTARSVALGRSFSYIIKHKSSATVSVAKRLKSV